MIQTTESNRTPRIEGERNVRKSPGTIRAITAVLLVAALSGSLFGCQRADQVNNAPEPPASWETTIGTLAEADPVPSQEPPPPMLRDPQTAVYSYMLWISYAYRTLNSQITTQAYDPFQEVRVSAYVDYNRQEKQALDQRILVAKVKSTESVGNTATVAMHEEWAYRYIDITTGKYKTPVTRVTYESTYTVVKQADNWLVNSVEASRTSPR